MISYEVNLICNECKMLETSMTHELSLDTPEIAKDELLEWAKDNDWDIENELCPNCKEKK